MLHSVEATNASVDLDCSSTNHHTIFNVNYLKVNNTLTKIQPSDKVEKRVKMQTEFAVFSKCKHWINNYNKEKKKKRRWVNKKQEKINKKRRRNKKKEGVTTCTRKNGQSQLVSLFHKPSIDIIHVHLLKQCWLHKNSENISFLLNAKYASQKGTRTST